MPLRPQDELLKAFWKLIPDRAAEATNLWMAVEDGDEGKLTELKRLLHTIKGEAHMLGATACGELMEKTEHLVGTLSAGELPARRVGDLMLMVFEIMVALSSTSGPGDTPFDTGPVIAQIDAVLTGASEPETAASKVGVFAAAETTGHSILPPPPPSHRPATGTSKQPGTPAGEAPGTEPLAPAGQALGPTRTNLSVQQVQPHVHELRRLLGEQTPLGKDLREVHRMLRALLAELDPALSPAQLAERLTKTLGYGWEVERRVARIRTQWSQGEFSLQMAVDSLDNEVRTAAMVGLDSMLGRLVRTARSTAAELDKQVELSMEGNAFVDDTVAQKLDTAFVHLVRNAVDHGIEDPATRQARGKDPVGHLQIRVVGAEGRVTVEFEDDGGGVNIQALRDRLGVNASELTDAQALQTIFQHGTTSRSTVTHISGRGVGLDAVAEALGQVGGGIDVRTDWQKGTVFRLWVPATTAADMVLPVQAGPFRCGFPSSAVRMVLRAAETEETAQGTFVRIPLGDRVQLVPAYALAEVLGDRGELRRGVPMVVVEHRGASRALAIDGYESPRPVALEPVSELACDCPTVIGAAATPDGGVLLVLDPNEILELTTSRVGAAMKKEAKGRSKAHILVAEDAPVARELLCGILRSFGLRVTDTPDGRQALSAALEDPPDLLITDVEMPFMGGLELVARLREDPQFMHLPVLVLTTRDDPQTRAQANRLEVRGFLSKQKFVEAELRRLIDTCLSDS